MKKLLVLITFLSSISLFSQNTINQFDSNGKRHGLWKKTYEGYDQLRYQGTFEHGKEVGEFMFYKPKYGKQPSAIKTYSKDTDLVLVSYFTKKGKLISKGQLKDRLRTGKWEYYHNNTDAIMMIEHYKDDKLHGKKTAYFDNGNITEEYNYINGNKEGDYKLYSLNGVLLQHLNYKNDELHGAALFYSGKGEVTKKGQYKNGRKDGYWQYYDQGNLTEEIFFPINTSRKKG